jgi:glycerol kinase
MRIIDSAADSEDAAFSVEDSGGVYFVPAFVGLGAPYWEPDTKGTIVGITRGTSREHIIRAALESIAFQSRDLIEAIEGDLDEKIKNLKVDGGASLNSFLIQFQADILGIPVTPSRIAETTALGAAYIAGLQRGYWNDKDEIVKNWQARKTFTPKIDNFDREKLESNWAKAIEAARVYSNF